jgi:hypothetical protein
MDQEGNIYGGLKVSSHVKSVRKTYVVIES